MNAPALPAHDASATDYGNVGALLFSNLVANHATNGRAADSTDRTATREYCTAHGADTGANGRALVAIRHPGATAQAQKHCNNQCTDYNIFHVFHRVYL
jgi:hypothetical protein